MTNKLVYIHKRHLKENEILMNECGVLIRILDLYIFEWIFFIVSR